MAVAIAVFGGNRSSPVLRGPEMSSYFSENRIDTPFAEFNLRTKMKYQIEGMVVATEMSYALQGLRTIAPKRIGLVWGDLASKKGSRLNWRYEDGSLVYDYPGDSVASQFGGMSGIVRKSSDNYLVVGSKSVKRKVLKIKKGDCVRIKGFLVDVSLQVADLKGMAKLLQEGIKVTEDANVWKVISKKWRTSTSIDDFTGDSSEIIYVTDVEWIRR